MQFNDERFAIAAMLKFPNALDTSRRALNFQPDAFEDEYSKTIICAMSDLERNKKPITAISIAGILSTKDATGASNLLWEILRASPDDEREGVAAINRVARLWEQRDMDTPIIATIDDRQEKGVKQSAMLLRLATGVELHHDADNTAYATFYAAGARQTHRIWSSAFKSWLSWRAFNELDLTPSANAMQEALGVLEGKAVHAGKLTKVNVRVAEHNGCIYLDLANEKWEAVEVSRDGWRVIAEPPVRFIRGAGMLPMATPQCGTVQELRSFVNVASDCDFEIILGWLIGALQPRGPYPVLALSGRQGSAKSTCARLMFSLIDPNKAPTRSAPKSEDDLIVVSGHSRIICFDNVSSISESMSDALCRICTGGGTAKRRLYTDDEAVILDVCAPMILTGLGAFITRGDLADRALTVQLRPLRDGEYRPERELWATFEEARPRILGGLLDALSMSIRRRGEVTGTSRMADFDAAVEAAGPAFGWQPGHFNRLLATVRDRARKDHLADDELGQALMEIAPWNGKMAELRALLAAKSNSQHWLPKSARGLSSAITRIEPLLENVGLIVRKGKSGERFVTLQWEAGSNTPNVPRGPDKARGTAAGNGTLAYNEPQLPSNVLKSQALEPDLLGARAHQAHSEDDYSLSDLERMADDAGEGDAG